MKVTTNTLKALRSIGWPILRPLCREASLNHSTVYAKATQDRELSEDQSEALSKALEAGIKRLEGASE